MLRRRSHESRVAAQLHAMQAFELELCARSLTAAQRDLCGVDDVMAEAIRRMVAQILACKRRVMKGIGDGFTHGTTREF